MPILTDLTGLASVACAMAAMLLRFPAVARLPKVRLAAMLGAVFVLSLIPFGGMPVAAYLRGATGDLSITTLVLLWSALLKPWCDRLMVDGKNRHALLTLVALVALVFYPLALGVGMFDPYRLGYGDSLFIAALLLIVLTAWINESSMILLCIALSTLAWSLGWYESDNLWDYLLDPFVVIYALAVIAILSVKKSMNRNRVSTQNKS